MLNLLIKNLVALHNLSDYQIHAFWIVVIVPLGFPNLSPFGNFISGENKEKKFKGTGKSINTEAFDAQLLIENKR